MSSSSIVRTVRKAAPPKDEEEKQREDIQLLASFAVQVAEGRTHRSGFWPNLAAAILGRMQSHEGRELYRFHHERWRVNGRKACASPPASKCSTEGDK